MVVIDSGYGNNTSFLIELEARNLRYLRGIAKNRKVTINQGKGKQETIRVDHLAQTFPREAFTEVELNLDKQKTLWVTTREVEISRLQGKRSLAIVTDSSR